MGTEACFIDLLTWVKDRGLTPPRPHPDEKFILAFPKKMAKWSRLMEHQKRVALWVPTLNGLREKGIKVETHHAHNLIVVRGGNQIGAGTCEHTAVLSYLHQVRKSQAD